MTVRKAYLKVDNIMEDIFSNQKWVEIQQSSGETCLGLFQDCHFKDNSPKSSQIEVMIIDENETLAAIRVPSGEHCGVYGKNFDGSPYVDVPKSSLEYIN